MNEPAPWAQSIHHIGRVVPDIEVAMAQLSAHYGVGWTPVRRYELEVRDEGREVRVAMSVALSCDAPLYIELFEEASGSPWTRRRGDPIHHLCYWVPDRVGEAERLMALGWHLEVTGVGPDEINGFCYLVGPDGMRMEPKSLDDPAAGAQPWLGGRSRS